eukprot:SAG11_NODE_6311_length_1340_cov_1.703465_3_plen_25_part_01
MWSRYGVRLRAPRRETSERAEGANM